MSQSFEMILDAVMHMPRGDQMRILSQVALDISKAYPGIDFKDHVCGGAARIIRTRIPVWLLESLRRQGKTDAELLTAYPSLTAEDLANAWSYSRAHRQEMDQAIQANSDEA